MNDVRGDAVVLAGTGPHLVGRAKDAAVHVDDRRVSRVHATITFAHGAWVYTDAASATGSFTDGERITDLVIDRPVELRLGDPTDGAIVELAPLEVRPSVAPTRTAPTEPVGAPEPRAPSPASRPDTSATQQGRAVAMRTTIGRDPTNDVVISELVVSRRHAELRAGVDGTVVLVDVGSHNGTFVDGDRIREAVVNEESRITIGSTELRVAGNTLRVAQPVSAPALAARHLSVTVGDGQRLLDDISFSVPAGSLIAVVGPTGAGKSTLLKAITGFRPPDAGDVLVDGRSLYRHFEELRLGLGYVPQEDILHPQLSIRRALRFGAELRFPPDTSAAERDDRVEEVMGELGLTERADLAIEKLSGGQRKRTSVALELLTKPSLLFLDEPTSGLDPGYEQAVMQLLRDLADGGRTVVVVTHSLASLGLCDRVLFLARGGRSAFFGRPDEALDHFGASDYPSVFRALDARELPDTVPVGSGRRDRNPTRHNEPVSDVSVPASIDWKAQVSTLVRRHAAILTADRRNLAFLVGAALVPAILILVLVGSDALSVAAVLPRKSARTLLGALVITATSLGAANGLREIVKEEAIYLRERAVGLHRSAYLVAKLAVLGAITGVQVVVLVFIATLNAHGPLTANLLPGRVELVVDVAVAGIATVAFGLLISALVSTSEKAMALIPVVFVVSWLFSGVAIDLTTKPVMSDLAYLTTSNWGVAAAANTADLIALENHACDPRASPITQPSSGPSVATTAPPHCDARWHQGTGSWLLALGMLALLGTGAMLATDWALARKEPLAAERQRYAIALAYRWVRRRVELAHHA